MSRIGRMAITIPAGVELKYENSIVKVKGPKGELSQRIDDRNIDLQIDGTNLNVVRLREDKQTKAKHGLYRQLINNMVNGVVKPYSKTLIINGVGWKVSMQGNKLVMNIGFSHPVEFTAIDGITITCPDATSVLITGISKEKVGQVAATIRSKRPVEPYHAYGIRYSDEVVVRKEGKTGGK